MTFTIYCDGQSEAARHERVVIDELIDPFGDLMPQRSQTLIGDRPVSITRDVLCDVLSTSEPRARTSYRCAVCGLDVAVRLETWEAKVAPNVDALVGHGVSQLPLIALSRML